MLDKDLLDAYQNTDYTVCAEPPFLLHIGEQSPELLRLYCDKGVTTAALITACNPHSIRTSDPENAVRQQALQSGLVARGWQLLESVGQDPTRRWPDEPGYLVLGINRNDAAAWGRQSGQNAIVFCAGDAVPELMVLV